MQMNIQRHLAKGYDTIPIVVAQDEVKGLSVFYAGPQILKKDTVVGAWQIFVREDLVDEWIESGELANTTEVQTFWETYSIEHKYEGEEHRWFSFPVGERPGAEVARIRCADAPAARTRPRRIQQHDPARLDDRVVRT